MLILIFLLSFFLLLTSFIQFRKAISFSVYLGLLALFFKCFYQGLVVFRQFYPRFLIDPVWLKVISLTHFGFFLSLIFAASLPSLLKVQKRIALKIPLLVILIIYMVEVRYIYIAELSFLFLGFLILYFKRDNLRIVFRDYFSYWFFSVMLVILRQLFAPYELQALIEIILLIFYYKTCSQLMVKDYICKKINT